MNKEFYERLLLAGEIIGITERYGRRLPILDAMYYFADKGDSTSEPYMWLTEIGESVKWEEHLYNLPNKVLGLKPDPQEWRGNIHTPLETKLQDKNYNEYFTNYYKPLINNLLRKYYKLWTSRLETKIGRGASIEKEVYEYLMSVYEVHEDLEIKPYISCEDGKIVEKSSQGSMGFFGDFQ